MKRENLTKANELNNTLFKLEKQYGLVTAERRVTFEIPIGSYEKIVIQGSPMFEMVKTILTTKLQLQMDELNSELKALE